MPAEVVTRKGDDGQAYWLLGGLYEVLVSGDESGGEATVMRITVPAGTGSPPHTHSGPEIMYVLEGEVRVHVGDETVTATAGSTFHFPAGTLEFFEASTEATVLATYLPGGIDAFFAEVGEPALSRTIPPADDTEPDFPRIAAAGARYGLEIKPPA